MKSLKVEGFTRELGKPLDWDDSKIGCDSLPITDGEIGGYPAMTSVWEPTPEERRLLADEGYQVHFSIIGQVHPPIMAQVRKAKKVSDENQHDS